VLLFVMNNKGGAIEMSMTTIVVVVLSMSLLIMGLVLVRSIFSGAQDISELTEEQVKGKIRGLFGDDRRLALFPDNRQVRVDRGDQNAFIVGIRNRIEGSGGNNEVFSYSVTGSDSGNCGLSASELESFIQLGKSGSDIRVAGDQLFGEKVVVKIPDTAPLCTFRYRITVLKGDGSTYDSGSMDIKIE
jgi:hypothetical protein